MKKAGTLIWFRHANQTVFEGIHLPEAEAKGAGHGELCSNPHVKCRKQVGG